MPWVLPFRFMFWSGQRNVCGPSIKKSLLAAGLVPHFVLFMVRSSFESKVVGSDNSSNWPFAGTGWAISSVVGGHFSQDVGPGKMREVAKQIRGQDESPSEEYSDDQGFEETNRAIPPQDQMHWTSESSVLSWGEQMIPFWTSEQVLIDLPICIHRDEYVDRWKTAADRQA